MNIQIERRSKMLDQGDRIRLGHSVGMTCFLDQVRGNDMVNDIQYLPRDLGSAGKQEAQLKREIPVGWAVNTLPQIANIIMGRPPAEESYNENEIGTLFFQGSTNFGWLFLTPRQYIASSTRMTEKGDILLSARVLVGDMNIVSADCYIG